LPTTYIYTEEISTSTIKQQIVCRESTFLGHQIAVNHRSEIMSTRDTKQNTLMNMNVKCQQVDTNNMVSTQTRYNLMFESTQYSPDEKIKVRIYISTDNK
jgi:hypothetical protein